MRKEVNLVFLVKEYESFETLKLFVYFRVRSRYMKEITEKYRNAPKSVKASLWYVVSSLMQRGIAFVTTPIFTRLMTTEQYGQVTIFLSWQEIFLVFATLNLFYGVYNNALVKYEGDRDVVTSSMLGLCTTLTVGLFIVYCLFYPWINRLTGMSTLMTFTLFIQILFVPAFRFWSTRQRHEYKYRMLVILSLIISTLTPLLGVPAVLLSPDKGYAKIATSVIAQVVVAIFLYISIFRNGKKYYNRKYWRYALAFNIPLIPHYLSAVALNQSDRVMIDNMCGTDKAGIYGLAYTIGAIAILFNEAIMNSFTPWTYNKLKSRNFSDVKRNTNYLIIFIAFVTIAFVAIAPELVLILGGEKYAEGIWIIAPISASVFFRLLYSLYANVEFYYEENYFIMIASVTCALLNILTNYVFIKIFGYLAAGYTTLLCYVLYTLSHYVFHRRVFAKHTGKARLYDDRFILFMSIIVVMLCLLMMLLFSIPIARYLLVATMLVCGMLMREKLLELIRMVKK